MIKRLLIVGDSFCQSRKKLTDWPKHLGKLLDLPVVGCGYGGNSWWTNQILLERFNEPKSNTLLIVVHTDLVRLPNDFTLPVTFGVLHDKFESSQNILNKNLKLFTLAKDFYESELFSYDFYKWAQAAWIRELDSNREYYNIIHIPAFNTVDLSDVKNGIVLQPSSDLKSLRDLSDLEIIQKPGEIRWHGPDSRSNHLSDFNNVKLAEAIANVIKEVASNKPDLRYFNNLDQWVFTPTEFKSG